MKPDDPQIPPEEIVYRRVPGIPFEHMVLIDEESGEVTVKRGAFRMDDDGCSSNRHSLLEANGLTWEAVRKKPEHGVLRVGVSDIRQSGLGIADDPWPNDEASGLRVPADVAHALITVPDDLSKKGKQQALSAVAKTARVMPVD